MMIGAKSFWWALASLPLMIVGALSPWARTLGGRVDGSQDEFVLLLAIVAGFMLLFLAASERRWLAVIPLLAGLTAAALTGNDITDIADFAPQVSGRFVSVEWGIYLALFGSTSLVLASVLLFVETTRTRAGAAPTRCRLGRHLVLTETARRKAFVQDAASFTPYVAVETSGVEVEKEGTLFFLPTRQKAGRDRFMKAEWKENRHLQRALDALEQVGVEVPRTMFVDVGAHIGTTTITAIRRFGFESALAFEPELGNFRLLRANLAFNDLETRIQTLNVAVSNRIGKAELKLRPSMGSKQRLLRGDEVAANSVRVPLTTLRRSRRGRKPRSGGGEPALARYQGSRTRSLAGRPGAAGAIGADRDGVHPTRTPTGRPAGGSPLVARRALHARARPASPAGRRP